MENNNKKLTPQQKYYEANKEKIRLQRNKRYAEQKDSVKEYREANKDKLKEYNRDYREANKDKLKESREANKDKLKEYSKDYYHQNIEKINKQKKEYNELNKEKISKQRYEYVMNKLKTDPVYKFKHNVRNLISSSIKKRGGKKLTKTELILGCTFDEFRTYIESLWQPWMNWDNYGNPKDGIYEPNKTWDFDHIIPVTKGMDELEINKLNHHTNIQPLCSYINRFVKRDSF